MNLHQTILLAALLGLQAVGATTIAVTSTAQQFGDFTYSSDGSVITITGYTGAGGAVTIPTLIDDLPVTTISGGAFLETPLTSVTIPGGITNIGGGAFAYCYRLTAITVDAANPSYTSSGGVLFDKNQTRLIQYPADKGGNYVIPASVTYIGLAAFASSFDLTSVTIPGSVTNIGDFAFDECESLTSITIPGSVTRIGSSAFHHCYALSNMTIPANVTSIGRGLFAGCLSLPAINVAADNAFYSSVDGVLFNKALSTLIQFPGAKGGAYDIPESVTNIEVTAFQWCERLSSVTIPHGVTTIGAWAFEGTGLWNVTIPASVTTIEAWSFAFNRYLSEVFFKGNAPLGSDFDPFGQTAATIYYLPGTTGWNSTFAGRPTALWVLPNPVLLNFGPGFGVQANGFGFIVSWATNVPVVVEAGTNLANPAWIPLQSLNLTNGAASFSDPSAEHSQRFYRARPYLKNRHGEEPIS